ncbi:gp16 family protein [Lysobacter sp. CA199]|uniref:gp16 family protein n=1 Tax=Lysobacter sp. CA199 TaxID=3455608 RepID=UPI003F8D02AA
MTRPTQQLSRKQLITLIHVAKRELKLDEETYRMALVTGGGHASCADMTDAGLKRALAHFRSRGFVARSGRSGDDRRQANDPQSRKIRSLWLQLHAVSAVRNSSEAALGAFVKRMTGIDTLNWLNTEQASRVIEELKAWLHRTSGVSDGQG